MTAQLSPGKSRWKWQREVRPRSEKWAWRRSVRAEIQNLPERIRKSSVRRTFLCSSLKGFKRQSKLIVLRLATKLLHLHSTVRQSPVHLPLTVRNARNKSACFFYNKRGTQLPIKCIYKPSQIKQTKSRITDATNPIQFYPIPSK